VFQLAIAGFNFLLNLWLIPAHGWRGAAWASLATDGLLGIVYWIFIRWLLLQCNRKSEKIKELASNKLLCAAKGA
jgi:Na+-driven multidrug efflux pump